MPSTSPTARSIRAKSQPAGRRIAIAVDVLAEKLDFLIAHARQLARFLENAFAGAATLGTARERHHAIGAGFVAALDDGDVGAVRIVAAREGRVEGFFRVQAQAGDMAIAGFQLHQHFGELRIAGRSCHQAHEWRALEDSLAFLLRHAAQYAENFAAAVIFLELLQSMENFLLGLVANAAGVV